MQIKTLAEMERLQTENDTSDGGIRLARSELGIETFGFNVEEFPANSGEEYYPAHDHKDDGQQEVYFCFEGSGEIQVNDGDWTAFEKGTFIRLDPDEQRRFRSGDEGMKLLAMSHPLSKDEAYEAPEWTQAGSTKGASEEQGASGQEQGQEEHQQS